MKTLYDQLSPTEYTALALILGFKTTKGNKTATATGYRLNLREIPAFDHNFSMGEALDAYTTYINRFNPKYQKGQS